MYRTFWLLYSSNAYRFILVHSERQPLHKGLEDHFQCKEVKSAGAGAGLTAVALLAMVPSYISRYVAASYDNEAVAIFALTFTFYLYINSFLLFGAVWAVFHSLYGSGTVNHLDYLGVHVARLLDLDSFIFVNMLPWESGEDVWNEI
ncbi:hypothetical protein FNV43_RR00364 [Rhamnella rubrinervis]|uniref:dolichyl-diphosphooligosaccharide--protein glycotransferase n=1 Tax=Rhamnella rubrinervis TaxID=2594499 RepID=A0A8K0MRC2_9ROSA|nr:hypothetical protein FNV43_RR00364 [Rhamnella rubrinervis]